MRWRKIRRDLWLHRQQTLLALVAVGISVFACTTLLVTRALLVKSLTQATAAVPRPDALFRVTGLPPAMLAAVQTVAGVAAVGASRTDTFRMKYGDELWYELRLQARSTLTDSQQSGLQLTAGVWPTTVPLALALEASAAAVTAARPGDTVVIYQDDLGEKSVPVVGAIADSMATPSRFLSNLLHGFATLDGLTALTGRSGYDWLYLRLRPGLTTTEQAHVLSAVQTRLTAAGIPSALRQLEEDATTLLRFVETAITLLTVLALLGNLLSVVWISNVMTTMMAREQAPIGVLKTMGFQRWQIMQIYLAQALLVGAVATAGALLASYGAGVLLAQQTATWLLARHMTVFTPPLAVWGVGLLVGLLLPVLGALLPVWRGTGLPVRQTLTQGAQLAAYGEGWVTAARRGDGYSPHLLYIGRNLLRHKERVAFTLTTLTLAGAIFVILTTLNASLQRSLQMVMNYWLADVRLETHVPIGSYLVRNEIMALAGTAQVEARLLGESRRKRPDGTQSPRAINLVGLPPQSPFLQPTLVGGRWLRADDLNSVVIDTELLRMEPGLQVGDPLVLTVAGKAVTWQIVGIVTSQLLGYSLTDSAVAYTNYRYLSEISGYSGQANFFLIDATAHDATAQFDLARRIEDSLHRYRFTPMVMEPNVVRRQTATQIFDLLLSVVWGLGLLFALVGGLSLLNLMRLTVMARRHEIGVIRAMGGDRRTLFRLITGEAMAVGLGSGLLALVVAWPLSWLLCRRVGLVLLNTPLDYHYSRGGALGWLLLSLSFAGISTWLALRPMTGGAVQELLRNE